MGILNVTPDSFSDGGLYDDPDRAIARGLALVADGASIVDVGGESTRPGAEPVSETEEKARILNVVDGLVSEGIVVSVDTSKPEVAAAALEAGAEIINDVTGLRSTGMVKVVAEAGCGIVVMHMQGRPADMHLDPSYDDVVSEVEAFLLERVGHLAEAGVSRHRIAIDPGLGFGKRARHSIELLGNFSRLAGHGLPLVLGASRKGFLGDLIGEDDPSRRDLATAVTTAMGFRSGARIFRVHDVAASRQAVDVARAIPAQ